jgi:hypothetical protein
VVTKWVERQISSYPGNDFVVTSRPHGFPSLVIAQADILAVRPFSAEQVSLFLNRWYLATERHATGASSESEMRSVRILASKSADRLIALLRVHPALHDLTVNPLLLTMIAMVHRYRGALPGSRTDLYAEICQVMLSRRIQAKDLPEVVPGLAKHKLLASLAYHMMLDHVSELSAKQALDVLSPVMRRWSRTVTGQAFLDDVARNGLLTEPVPGRYTFAHLTFQEYLAARHISDIPDLAETLVRAVDDHWWRESILIYTAIANADQIVRACLDKGTISALALAFDCAEASGELAPDLRQRLIEARSLAFTEGCDPPYQQVIAGVLAVRLSRENIVTAEGSRICSRPVPADLYWLFLRATRAARPYNLCELSHDDPATGVWGDEALTFVRWLNDMTAGSSQVEFRLPSPNELEKVADQVIKDLPDSVIGLWARRADSIVAELWVPTGHAHPHHVTADAIDQAVKADARNTGILASILTATALDAALTIFQLLLAYASERADDDAAFFRALERARDFAFALARYLGHDLDLDRDLAHARAAARGRRQVGDLDSRALALASDLAFIAARDLDLGLALVRKRGLHLDGELAFFSANDLVRALDLMLGRPFGRNPRALARRRGVLSVTPDHAFAIGGQVVAPAIRDGRLARLAVRVLEIPALPLTWVSRGPLGAASRPMHAADSAASSSEQVFTKTLTHLAGISRTAVIAGSLDRSLIESLRRIGIATPQRDRTDAGWSLAYIASRLADAAVPLFGMHRQPTDLEAASVRVVALALASSCAEEGDPGVDILHTLAATVTLLQRRAEGTAPIGEGIVLALS